MEAIRRNLRIHDPEWIDFGGGRGVGPRDIAVAGCGIGGLAVALLLSRDGHRVTLFDRFERPRPIGSGLMLQPTGLAVLDRLGLTDRILAHSARVERLLGRTADGRTVLDVGYAALAGQRFGLGIHRASLFGILYDAVVAANIAIETGSTVVAAGCRSGGGRTLVLESGHARPFDLVVDALGARSPLSGELARPLDYGALWLSLPWPDANFRCDALEQRYRAASVMAGVLPTGTRPGGAGNEASFFWSLRADALDAWRATGLGAWKKDVAALWPDCEDLLASVIDPDQLTFARYAHRTLRQPAAPGLIHIGDAWHSTSPQLGQGANMALLDAFGLASALRTERDVPAALAHAVALRQDHVRLYQALSLVFTPVYQSDSRVIPAIRDYLVGPVSTIWPAPQIQAATVAGLVGWPLRRLGLD